MPRAARTAHARHAVYWVPARTHPLWDAGRAWLGRDPERPGDPGPAPRPHIEAPRRYGLHATLEAPMRLEPGRDPEAFRAAVRAIAAGTDTFALPPLQVATLGGFVALRPVHEPHAHHPLLQLAERCVRELDAWRAPPAPRELERRLAGLDEDQQALLKRFGSPHVLHRWRFHVTLSDTLPPDAAARRDAIARDARAHFAAALAVPLDCTEIAVFIEPARGQPFELVERMPLRASRATR